MVTQDAHIAGPLGAIGEDPEYPPSISFVDMVYWVLRKGVHRNRTKSPNGAEF